MYIQNNMLKKIGPVQQKILLICLIGVGLAFSASPTKSLGLLRAAGQEWRSINRQTLRRSIRSLSHDKLITEKKRTDGTVILELTPEGKRQARYWHFFGGGVKLSKPKEWDTLWRVVMFDIPEKDRRFRNTLRTHLQTIGFRELQHSVFIFPYPCEQELAAVINLYNAEKFVRILTVKKIDNEQALKQIFFRSKKK